MSIFAYRRHSLLIILLLLSAITSPCLSAASPVSVPVVVKPVSEQSIYRELQLTGTATSPQVSRLSAATSGLVLKLYADAGSQVQAGDVLLQLDPELAELELKSALAKVKQAENALRDVERRLQEARSLRSQRSIAESLVRDLEAEVIEDQTALQQVEADANLSRAILKRHTVKAPFAGVVRNKLTEQGEWVTPGQAVFELVATDNVRLDFAVSEDYLAHIDSGTPVTIRLNAAPQREYIGRVGTIVPVSDPGARTFLLRVLVENADHTIIPGMSVQARLKVATGRTGLLVPRDATQRYADGRVIVWSVKEQAEGLVVVENLVRIGLAFDGLVEIHEGLMPDARVVVQGNESLKNGQSVTLMPAH